MIVILEFFFQGLENEPNHIARFYPETRRCQLKGPIYL
jgi:hypothetical protein